MVHMGAVTAREWCYPGTHHINPLPPSLVPCVPGRPWSLLNNSNQQQLPHEPAHTARGAPCQQRTTP